MSNYQTTPSNEQYFSPESIQGVTASRLAVVERALSNEIFSVGPLAQEFPLEALLDAPLPDTVAAAEALEEAVHIVNAASPETQPNPLAALVDTPIPGTIAGAEALDTADAQAITEAQKVVDDAMANIASEAANDTENILTAPENNTLIDNLEHEAYVNQLSTLEQRRNDVEQAYLSQNGATDVSA